MFSFNLNQINFSTRSYLRTENTPMIVGLGKAAELVTKNLEKYSCHMKEIRDYLEEKLIVFRINFFFFIKFNEAVLFCSSANSETKTFALMDAQGDCRIRVTFLCWGASSIKDMLF